MVVHWTANISIIQVFVFLFLGKCTLHTHTHTQCDDWFSYGSVRIYGSKTSHIDSSASSTPKVCVKNAREIFPHAFSVEVQIFANFGRSQSRIAWHMDIKEISELKTKKRVNWKRIVKLIRNRRLRPNSLCWNWKKAYIFHDYTCFSNLFANRQQLGIATVNLHQFLAQAPKRLES